MGEKREADERGEHTRHDDGRRQSRGRRELRTREQAVDEQTERGDADDRGPPMSGSQAFASGGAGTPASAASKPSAHDHCASPASTSAGAVHMTMTIARPSPMSPRSRINATAATAVISGMIPIVSNGSTTAMPRSANAPSIQTEITPAKTERISAAIDSTNARRALRRAAVPCTTAPQTSARIGAVRSSCSAASTRVATKTCPLRARQARGYQRRRRRNGASDAFTPAPPSAP